MCAPGKVVLCQTHTHTHTHTHTNTNTHTHTHTHARARAHTYTHTHTHAHTRTHKQTPPPQVLGPTPFMTSALLEKFEKSLNGVFEFNLNPSLVEGAAAGEAEAMDTVRGWGISVTQGGLHWATYGDPSPHSAPFVIASVKVSSFSRFLQRLHALRSALCLSSPFPCCPHFDCGLFFFSFYSLTFASSSHSLSLHFSISPLVITFTTM
jgi:hypothetical protein